MLDFPEIKLQFHISLLLQLHSNQSKANQIFSNMAFNTVNDTEIGLMHVPSLLTVRSGQSELSTYLIYLLST